MNTHKINWISMIRKGLSGLVVLALAVLLLPVTAHADTGPKPSVSIEFAGIEEPVYYVTLLSKEESTGPYSYSTDPINQDSFLVDEYGDDAMIAWQAFRDYQDPDGFYFIEYFEHSNEKHTFNWSYYPPSTFKVLIYFPSDGHFITSDVLERYAFDSYYQVNLSADGSALTAERNYNYSDEGFSLLARIVITLIVEILIALLFGLRKKNILLFILVVNIVTQITLNILLNLIAYSRGGFAFVFHYIWMELLVTLIEALAYSYYSQKNQGDKPIKKRLPLVYAIVANCASFVIGLLISFQLPGIF